MFVVALALVPQAALAHAQLVQSGPDANAVLQSPPTEIVLMFTEPVTAAGPGIRVYSPSGKQVAGVAVTHGAAMTAPVKSEERGTFIVTWQVFASDTHPSRGVFAYSVGAPSSNPYSTLLSSGSLGTATPLGLALQAIAHWIHFAGFALVFGVAGYRALSGATGMNRAIGAGILLLIAAEPVAVIAQLASLSFDGDTAVAILGSEFGRLAALRLGAALLAWTVLATGRSWPLLATGAVVALLDGQAAHAVPGYPGLGQGLVAVHVAAMGLWAGGLAGYVQKPDPRFGRYAAITFGVAAGTGLILAIAHDPSVAALLDSDYGRALLVKVAVVAAVVATVILRRRRLELGGAVVILGAAAVVAALPPSR